MSKKQLLALFVYNLVVWTVGNGLMPLLPVYAKQLGADSTAAGYYLAFSYFALAVGAIAAGWLSDKFRRHKIPLIILGSVGIPVTWLIGQVGNIWGLSLLTAVLWACGGLELALAGILAGLSAGEHERGKIFGILSLANGLGALIGGLSTGYIADRWGYPVMFSVVAVFLVLLPLAGLFLKEKEVRQGQRQDGLLKKKANLGNNFFLLFSASLVASIAGVTILLGRSLQMSDLDFGALAISSTGAVGGIVAMPIPLLMGWLSDRTGRKIYMYLGYLACITSLIVLAIATSLWNFYIVLILQSIFAGINATVGNAMVTDLVPRESLGKGISLFSATTWIGGVLGFAGAGFSIKHLGMLPTFIVGMCLPLIAIVLLIPIRSKVKGHGTISGSRF
jgi:MFS family permease